MRQQSADLVAADTVARIPPVFNPSLFRPRDVRDILSAIVNSPKVLFAAGPASGVHLEKNPLSADIDFLVYHGVAVGELVKATERARELGITARRCLLASGAIDEADFVDKASLHFGVARMARARLDRRVELESALRQGWSRGTSPDGLPVLIIDASGPAFPIVRDCGRFSDRRHIALATSNEFRELLLGHFGEAIAHSASNSVPDEQSARQRVSAGQRVTALIAAIGLFAALLLQPALTLTVLPLLLGCIFLGAAVLHLSACWVGWSVEKPTIVRCDEALPTYSVLVPLHREGFEVVRPLVEALAGLDFPREKLQILLVAETGDVLTQNAVRQCILPANMTVFIAPDGDPRTKPRALNTAMPFVTGECVVIYDAEDRPDPLQLRKAAALFAASPPHVACLQARLTIDNAADGILPAFFRLEYAALFDVTKSGSARLGHPIPLGGTSNHFRTRALRQVGLWDAWNVTEDADLGFRLARYGYGVADLVSSTDEEAPVRLTAWMAQRSRWLKGWMQTALTHSRHPVQVARELGPGNMFAAIAMSLGVVVGTVFAPFFHVMVVWRIMAGGFCAGLTVLDSISDGLIIVLGIFGLLSTFVPAIIATRRRDLSGCLWLIPLLPFYHLLMAAAGWRAVYELAVAPHRWNKTTHGLAKSRGGRTADQKQ